MKGKTQTHLHVVEGGNAEAANVAVGTEDSLSKEEKGHPLALGNKVPKDIKASTMACGCCKCGSAALSVTVYVRSVNQSTVRDRLLPQALGNQGELEPLA